MTDRTPDIAVTVEDSSWDQALADAETLCRKAALAALAAAAPRLPSGPIEVSVVLADDALVQGLNRDWRGKDRPTNVLSFAALDGPATAQAADAPVLLGDVILAYGTCRAEAETDGKSLADHLTHLVVHGTLHLLGYDHETDDDASVMEGLETAILSAMGIADPHGGPIAAQGERTPA